MRTTRTTRCGEKAIIEVNMASFLRYTLDKKAPHNPSAFMRQACTEYVAGRTAPLNPIGVTITLDVTGALATALQANAASQEQTVTEVVQEAIVTYRSRLLQNSFAGAVSVTMTPEEAKALQAKADSQGITVEDAVREASVVALFGPSNEDPQPKPVVTRISLALTTELVKALQTIITVKGVEVTEAIQEAITTDIFGMSQQPLTNGASTRITTSQEGALQAIIKKKSWLNREDVWREIREDVLREAVVAYILDEPSPPKLITPDDPPTRPVSAHLTTHQATALQAKAEKRGLDKAKAFREAIADYLEATNGTK